MAKPQVSGVPFTADEFKVVNASIKSLCDMATKGAEKWSALRALCMNGNTLDKGRKAQIGELYRNEWLSRSKAKLGRDLTPDESIAARKVANSDFSRGMRDPDAVPKKKDAAVQPGKSTETAIPGAQSNATDAAGTTPQGKPGDVERYQMAKDVLIRVASVQAEMIAFQRDVRIPAQGIALIGDIAENLNKLHEQAQALVAALA